MKKIVFLLAISVLFTQLANSQTRVGVAGGVSIAKMDGKINGTGRAGSMFNLLLDTDLGRNFSFLPSIGYVQKGTVEATPGGTLIDKQFVALRYFELTTNLVYHIGDPNANNFYLGVGPALAFNLPSKRTTVTDGEKSNTDILFGPTAENDIRGIDYGINVLLALKTRGGFFITANWNKGLRNLSPEGTTVKTTNQYMGIQLGYYFSTSK